MNGKSKNKQLLKKQEAQQKKLVVAARRLCPCASVILSSLRRSSLAGAGQPIWSSLRFWYMQCVAATCQIYNILLDKCAGINALGTYLSVASQSGAWFPLQWGRLRRASEVRGRHSPRIPFDTWYSEMLVRYSPGQNLMQIGSAVLKLWVWEYLWVFGLSKGHADFCAQKLRVA